jgi:hypothetical protein
MYDEQSYNYHDTIVSSDSTVYTSPQSKRRAMAEYMKSDPGYRRIGKKNDKIDYYNTSIIPGTSIRNAISGIREYNMKVGSPVAESQFFKVRYAGEGISNVNGPDTLFYDTPEQFERHMNCSVKTVSKKIWKSRYDWATTPSKSSMV